MESTSQAVATTASQSSAMPTSVAAPSVAPSGMSQEATFQASPQAPAPAAPVAQQAQAGNPWQEAFQALSASLNTSSPVFGAGDLQSPSFNPGLLGIGGSQPSAAASRKPAAKRTRRK